MSEFTQKSFNGRLREMEKPMVFGYELDRETLTPKRNPLPPLVSGLDSGADPLGDGMFKMWPSGDVVDWAERNRRLKR
jgi:hypothetical protein